MSISEDIFLAEIFSHIQDVSEYRKPSGLPQICVKHKGSPIFMQVHFGFAEVRFKGWLLVMLKVLSLYFIIWADNVYSNFNDHTHIMSCVYSLSWLNFLLFAKVFALLRKN